VSNPVSVNKPQYKHVYADQTVIYHVQCIGMQSGAPQDNILILNYATHFITLFTGANKR